VTDLLAELRAAATRGRVVLPGGTTRHGWTLYGGGRGGLLVGADDRPPEDAQYGTTVHLRTAPNGSTGLPGVPHWFRMHTALHNTGAVLVRATFRIERHDPARGPNIGWKLGLAHQDNLTSYHLSAQVDGDLSIYKESRDGVDPNTWDTHGHQLAHRAGGWQPMLGSRPPRRHHLEAVHDPSTGRIGLRVDGGTWLETVDPQPIAGGQVALRLDGCDTTLHHLSVERLTP